MPVSFLCDAMLGGLARWLRAAGYDASWHVHISDRDLVHRACAEHRVLLSSDGDPFLFNLVRDGKVTSLFIPRGSSVQDQLELVLRRFQLPLRFPRCMTCGGQLLEVQKESVRDDVPTRSFQWVEQFWRCDRCGKVFWHGSHWSAIVERLRRATEPKSGN